MYVGERFNSITHLIGVFLAVAGVSVMMTLAVLTKDPWKITCCGIFGLSTIFLYGFSTLYHSLKGVSKKFFQKLDYVAIYIMIAGTYTPLTLLALRQDNGWYIFGAVWSLAVIGITQEIFRKPSPKRKLSLFIYLLMGWLILTVSKSLYSSLDFVSLLLLGLGGLFYSVGVVFFINDEKWPHAHGIWHLFVMAGTTCHYFCVMRFL